MSRSRQEVGIVNDPYISALGLDDLSKSLQGPAVIEGALGLSRVRLPEPEPARD